MRVLKIATLATFLALGFAGASGVFVSEANAQATCRNKCNDEEQACLKRTNNKSQCGGKAQTCASKCK
ncbi:MAG: hypothetical protein FD175_208 [Beijerinckiaceae bacterium]|nr:MAG: hypothetical protein FD175_208 [Beijerinckiaceae bacterium]